MIKKIEQNRCQIGEKDFFFSLQYSGNSLILNTIISKKKKGNKNTQEKLYYS